jgi:hypothetical protein
MVSRRQSHQGVWSLLLLGEGRRRTVEDGLVATRSSPAAVAHRSSVAASVPVCNLLVWNETVFRR